MTTTTAHPLDRRRDRAGAAGAAAEQAQATVTDLDHQLETIESLADQQRQALRRAQEETARLKRSLKTAGKRRGELIQDRKKAVARADKARSRARAAEAKYDKEVLADLIRREKERDRAGTSPAPQSSEPSQPAAAHSDPPPERELATKTTARRTAARRTAARS